MSGRDAERKGDAAISAKNATLIAGSDLVAAALEILEDYELIFIGRQPTESQLITLYQQHNPLAIPVRYGKIMAVVMGAAPASKMIAKHGSGIDVTDVKATATRGIMVRAATGANAIAVSEHTWVLILAYAKSVAPFDRRLREGHQDKSAYKSLELKGRTLGLVGLGTIGNRMARIVVAFNMKVLAYGPYAKMVPPECKRVDELKNLLMQVSILPLHCPLAQYDRGIINTATLAQYKPGAVLVNATRGGLIDDMTLTAALRAGTLHRVALDNFHSRPLTTPHIWQAIDNVILSSHMNGVSGTFYVKAGTAVAASILQVLQESAQTEIVF